MDGSINIAYKLLAYEASRKRVDNDTGYHVLHMHSSNKSSMKSQSII